MNKELENRKRELLSSVISLGGPGSGGAREGAGRPPGGAGDVHSELQQRGFIKEDTIGSGPTELTKYIKPSSSGMRSGHVLVHSESGGWSHHTAQGVSVGHGTGAESIGSHLEGKGYTKK